MMDFGGWEMPVQYEGILEEHRAVRERVGLFDVSHMGEFELTGPNALAALQKLTPNDVGRLSDGRCHYSAFLTERGTFVDSGLARTRAVGHPIGLALVPSGAQTVGTEFEVDIRGREKRARIVETPFDKRKKAAPA